MSTTASTTANDQTFGAINNLESSSFQNDDWKTFHGQDRGGMDRQGDAERGQSHRGRQDLVPLTEPGAYIVEASTDAKSVPSRLLVFVTDIAIVHKNLPGKGLIYLADARTGPAAGESCRARRRNVGRSTTKSRSIRTGYMLISTDLKTNQDGALEYKRKQALNGSSVNAIVTDGENRMAFSFFQNWQETDYGLPFENGPRIYVITDRPVYRPGSTVKFRAWIRQRQNGQYQNSAVAGQENVSRSKFTIPKQSKMETLTLHDGRVGLRLRRVHARRQGAARRLYH